MSDTPNAEPIHPEESIVRFPFDPDSLMFAIPLAVITAVGAVWGIWWLWLPAGLLTAGVLAFFRDPRRAVPTGPGLVISPADGKIVGITRNDDPTFGPAPGKRVTIFLSVLNCHINRAPVAGVVTQVRYQPGLFLNAMAPESNDRNECNWVFMKAADGYDLTVRQIAGLIARRIVCRVREGSEVARGGRFGLIRFGSRLDVFLPEGARVLVAEGQMAVAGETVLADMKAAEPARSFRVG